MDTADRVILARRLAVAVVILTLAVMVLGSWVKATGSGLACPDWPKCYGQWLPPFPSMENGGMDPDVWDEADAYTQAQVLYEWGHRLLASLLGIPFLALVLVTFRRRDLHAGLRWLPFAAGWVLLVQILLGGITVVGKNAAPLTTAHLANATGFLVLVTLIAAFAYLRPLPTQQPVVKVRRQPGETRIIYPGEAPADE
jgi:heme a synthase